jgi:hypothetical protein
VHEFDFRRRKINWEAIAAYLVGVVVAYLFAVKLRFGGGGIFTTLVIVAVGGFWYHVRKVI